MKQRYFTTNEALSAFKNKANVLGNETFTQYWLRLFAFKKTAIEGIGGA